MIQQQVNFKRILIAFSSIMCLLFRHIKAELGSEVPQLGIFWCLVQCAEEKWPTSLSTYSHIWPDYAGIPVAMQGQGEGGPAGIRGGNHVTNHTTIRPRQGNHTQRKGGWKVQLNLRVLKWHSWENYRKGSVKEHCICTHIKFSDQKNCLSDNGSGPFNHLRRITPVTMLAFWDFFATVFFLFLGISFFIY